MATSRMIVMFCGLLLTANTATALTWSDVAWGVAGGTVAVVAAPYAAAAAGFGATGVAASSVAAKGMSVAATTGVGAGVVGTLQAVGAAGLTLAQSVIVAGIAGTTTTLTKKAFFDGEQEDKCG
ncbi:interferon alpha-inducible protein 27-like protein 2A [Littorina saxatilis]|uniref:interferon alpha-inducible protein 27-like protein 2A n=1 Tax=Littorina saxatilis TaxID=31220 RepID=UPI0038B47B49